MTEREYQNFWKLKDLAVFLRPRDSIGAGLIVATSQISKNSVIMQRTGGHGPKKVPLFEELMYLFRSLHMNQVSLAYSANASTLKADNPPRPMILANPQDLTWEEAVTIAKLIRRGAPCVAFSQKPLPSPLKEQFTANPSSCLWIRQEPASLNTLESMKELAPRIINTLRQPVRFPDGCAGYGFTSGSQQFLVVEDWLEQPRTVQLRLSSRQWSKAPRACNMNSHTPLTVVADGKDWLVELPLTPGNGVLICLEKGETR
ncbi:MAG: hypothetical protein D6820_11065 [Lentisphaerae bacterium]|nr:MAG: hypothetical protein D6820_11065 [Lentisphaerota bacterium]